MKIFKFILDSETVIYQQLQCHCRILSRWILMTLRVDKDFEQTFVLGDQAPIKEFLLFVAQILFF